MTETNRSEDIVDIINQMDQEDEPKEESVDLFDDFKPEAPFGVEEKESPRLAARTNFYSSSNQSKDVTIIGSSTSLKSDITILEGNLEFAGKITGNVAVNGDIVLCNGCVIEGDVTAYNIYPENDEETSCTIIGNLSIKNNAIITKGTVLTGDINAKQVVISGEIKGKIEAVGETYLKNTTVYQGDIITGTIKIDSGAQTNCSISIKH